MNVVKVQMQQIPESGGVTGVKGANEENFHDGNVSISLPDIINFGQNITYDPNTKTLSATAGQVVMDDVPTEGSENAAKSGGIYDSIKVKMDKDEVKSIPVEAVEALFQNS